MKANFKLVGCVCVILMCALLGNPAQAADKKDAAPPPVETQQKVARAWLDTNTVTAGRSRGGETVLVRRAVLVGINTYEPSADEARQLAAALKKAKGKQPSRILFQDLDGCVNDALAMQEILIARYGFRPGDIMVLTNRAATRAAMLQAIDKHLVQASGSNDVAFFFYAGHGSQVVNSRSDEPDKRDETIVTADSWRGTPDIRDKELRRLFNAALDRGVTLTAIFDCCHSGSTARGVVVDRKNRRAEPVLEDIADDTDFGPSPEEQGALILSAAQDDQLAEEHTGGGLPHGAFTAALLKVLRFSSTGQTASDIFLSLSSALQSSGHVQIPVLAGSTERRRMGLFGEQADLSGQVTVAVLKVGSDGQVKVRGGLGIGLNPGCQLRPAGSVTDTGGTMLEVTSVEGLTAAAAKVVAGALSGIREGDLFEVSRWTVAPAAILRVWIPPKPVSPDQLAAIVKWTGTLGSSSRFELVDDPTRVAPSHLLAWNGSDWVLTANGGKLAQFSGLPSLAKLEQAIPQTGSRAKLFISIPPSMELKTALVLPRDKGNDAIELASRPEEAQYVLLGSIRDGQPHYAWVLPNSDAESAALQSLPIRSYWFPTNNTPVNGTVVGRQLEDGAMRIGRIKAWLTLQPAVDSGQFPYRLALRSVRTGLLITAEDALTLNTSTESGRKQLRALLPVMSGGQSYKPVLYADPQALAQGVEPRFVYLFTIDSEGRSQLLWPRRGMGNAQRLPVTPAGSTSFPAQIPIINSSFGVGEPYGVDTYFLLTSLSDIPDATVLEFDGVRARERGLASDNPLQELLESVGGTKRAAQLPAPVDWSIQRLTVRSQAP